MSDNRRGSLDALTEPPGCVVVVLVALLLWALVAAAWAEGLGRSPP